MGFIKLINYIQAVALIRTLSTKPDILLMDEAFSALDYQTKIKVTNDVYRIIKEEKKTAIIVTHDIDEAVSMSNIVVVLSKRPAKINNVYNINIENFNTPLEKRKDLNYDYYYDLIWESLNTDE